MQPNKVAVIFIGFQNDYFHEKGILHGVFESKEMVQTALTNTCNLIKKLENTDVLLVAPPIKFTQDYSELHEPIGILKIIKDSKAFCEGGFGAQTVDELQQASPDIICLPGKRGLNAFSNTDLESLLTERGIEHVILAGAVTSLCIDTAGREAMDLGFKVTILNDCIVGRTLFEQDYYLKEIMPLYSNVICSNELCEQLG